MHKTQLDLKGSKILVVDDVPVNLDVLVRSLNTYLSAMTHIIVKYNGTIDEFIGDAILAVFGAPVLRADDSDRAIADAKAPL